MTISALPPKAVKAIGSTQSLTDPASVVKELIDNGLDARATAIYVEISTNTVDRIQVKDNGHGIDPEDRHLVCTRYCTSKIRDLDDLSNIGGRFLGFRGEALSSAAELSACLKLTTRVEGESTAVEYSYGQEGQSVAEKRVSHPVGTTVLILDFLKDLPVRRQTALKDRNISTTLPAIKRILQVYSLARPLIRFSLKVLKGKNDSWNFTYAPKIAMSGSTISAASTTDAATKIFGKKLTDHCQWNTSTWSSNGELVAPGEIEEPGCEDDLETYSLEALLPTADCSDFSSVSRPRCYISVDSRPVSSKRNTFKRIVSAFKSCFRSVIASSDDVKNVDPFMCLNIVCPRGAYDANIEPAKDDVLFTNAELVLQLVEKAFRNFYGAPRPILSSSPPSQPTHKPQGFELLLAKKTAEAIGTGARNPDLSPGSGVGMLQNFTPARDSLESLPSATASSRLCPQLSGDSDATAPKVMSEDYFQGAGSLPSSPQLPDQSSTTDRRQWRSSMYSDDDEDVELVDKDQISSRPQEINANDEEEETSRDLSVSNPWAIAKFNAAVRQPSKQSPISSTIETNLQLPTPRRQAGDARYQPSDDLVDDLEMMLERTPIRNQSQAGPFGTRSPSSPNPFPYPIKARAQRQDPMLDNQPTHRDRDGNGVLDAWIQASHDSESQSSYPPRYEDDAALSWRRQDIDRPHDFTSARALPMGTALADIPDISQKPRRKPSSHKQQQGNINKPFISPINDPDRVWFETGETRHSNKHPQKQSTIPFQNSNTPASLILRNNGDDESIISASPSSPSTSAASRPMHPDLAITLDYEARKQKAGQQYRKRIRQEEIAEKLRQRAIDANNNNQRLLIPSIPHSPYKNRQSKAIAALHDAPFRQSSVIEDHDNAYTNPENNEQPLSNDHIPTPPLNPTDPRAYLIRTHEREREENSHHQHLGGPTNNTKTPPRVSKRRKTALLPLETVREDDSVLELSLLLENTTAQTINRYSTALRGCDSYVSSGQGNEDAFASAGMEEIEEWQEVLRGLVRGLFRVEGRGGNEGEGRGEGGEEEEEDVGARIDLVGRLGSRGSV